MANRFHLNPTGEDTRQLVAWAAEQAGRDRTELERAGTGHDQSNYLRGRLSAWRELQSLAEPPRAVTIDGKAV